MQTNINMPDDSCERLGRRLARYALIAGGVGAASATDASAGIVGNSVVTPFGLNESVQIDLNGDGEIDFEIDHDRAQLNGADIDFLQIDKNDQVGLALPGVDFPDAGPVGINDDHGYLTDISGNYPTALSAGDTIGLGSSGLFEFQESSSYVGGGTTIRANRLIDEDAGQLDADAGTLTTLPGGAAGWTGLNGDVGYVGLAIDFNGGSDALSYGWVGVRITNEADATGEVVGFAYNDVPGEPILAGQVPEPSSLLIAGAAALALFGRRTLGRTRGRRV
ncbi:hypothetical protein Pla123a_31430 [Posidoniimonas polymericola]|uniref:Ice-binding protein C-terminal domain-containing protein n=1 Tax=Posidoniimonas polymericola TaxID=2528002 RepID=A0A5C5YL24_9BACT|nr:PEP-CTERM sorting domain-containing protein [Posidoniimonas polymericola]TWT75633.1 hypothetical protein Pla123a_31430 [Posidoniimonas polymericola]